MAVDRLLRVGSKRIIRTAGAPLLMTNAIVVSDQRARLGAAVATPMLNTCFIFDPPLDDILGRHSVNTLS